MLGLSNLQRKLILNLNKKININLILQPVNILVVADNMIV